MNYLIQLRWVVGGGEISNPSKFETGYKRRINGKPFFWGGGMFVKGEWRESGSFKKGFCLLRDA